MLTFRNWNSDIEQQFIHMFTHKICTKLNVSTIILIDPPTNKQQNKNKNLIKYFEGEAHVTGDVEGIIVVE